MVSLPGQEPCRDRTCRKPITRQNAVTPEGRPGRNRRPERMMVRGLNDGTVPTVGSTTLVEDRDRPPGETRQEEPTKKMRMHFLKGRPRCAIPGSGRRRQEIHPGTGSEDSQTGTTAVAAITAILRCSNRSIPKRTWPAAERRQREPKPEDDPEDLRGEYKP